MPSWVPEIETKPAPMPLLLVQSFVNTWEGDTGIDLLGDLSLAETWLHEAGLLQGSLREDDLAEAQMMREAIRALLVHNAGGPVPGAAELEVLSAVAARCSLQPVVGPEGGIELAPAGQLDRSALARLLLIIHDAQRDGTWARLKACRNPDCRWAYFDRSHAGRGAWCDMAVCGNRIKNRNLRSRRAQPPPPAHSSRRPRVAG
jgi:predicted RNA-binding Zn ribbon-like protein